MKLENPEAPIAREFIEKNRDLIPETKALEKATGIEIYVAGKGIIGNRLRIFLLVPTPSRAQFRKARDLAVSWNKRLIEFQGPEFERMGDLLTKEFVQDLYFSDPNSTPSQIARQLNDHFFLMLIVFEAETEAELESGRKKNQAVVLLRELRSVLRDEKINQCAHDGLEVIRNRESERQVHEELVLLRNKGKTMDVREAIIRVNSLFGKYKDWPVSSDRVKDARRYWRKKRGGKSK